MKCDHNSSEVIFTHNELSAEICSWGCSELLVSVKKENGVTVTFTVTELSAMQARIVELEKEKEFYKNNSSAWKDFAEHQEFCAVCAEDVDNCEDGSLLKCVANVKMEDVV